MAATSGPAPALLPQLQASLRRYWTQAPRYVHLAYVVGAVLMLVGLVHAGIWLVVGGSASGPLSWRKPSTFGFSFGLATITLGWVATQVRLPRRLGWIAAIVLCVSTTYEVAWVVVQHARGVPSHFNDATPLDERVFELGAVAIVATILVIVALTVVAFVRPATTAPMALAIRAGLVALLVAQATGLWMVVHGLSVRDSGVSMLSDSLTTYGAAGAMKVAHAVPMHAIQVFCGVAWLLSFSRRPAHRQFWLVAATIAVYAGLVGVTIVRTTSGLAPF
ncbi:hypothetical protein [Flindersiella endophytica]